MEFSSSEFTVSMPSCRQKKLPLTAIMKANYAVDANILNYSADCKMLIAGVTVRSEALEHSVKVE